MRLQPGDDCRIARLLGVERKALDRNLVLELAGRRVDLPRVPPAAHLVGLGRDRAGREARLDERGGVARPFPSALGPGDRLQLER
jgi:hypothetical protein